MSSSEKSEFRDECVLPSMGFRACVESISTAGEGVRLIEGNRTAPSKHQEEERRERKYLIN